MKMENEQYYSNLSEDLSILYKKIESLRFLNHQIDKKNDVVVIILHNHLKLTIIFENQFKEAVIYFDGRFVQFTHWHLDNYEAIKFVSDLIEDKKVFIESRLLHLIGSQFTFKILDIEKYLTNKNRYFGRRNKNIFTSSEIFQGSLSPLSKNSPSLPSEEHIETIKLLDNYVKDYNLMKDKDYKKQFDTFFGINEEIISLHKLDKIRIYAGDCLFSYFKSIIENDGPEYAAIIIFTVTGKEFYMSGVCVRGKPLLKKVKSNKKLKRSIKVMWGREGDYFKKS